MFSWVFGSGFYFDRVFSLSFWNVLSIALSSYVTPIEPLRWAVIHHLSWDFGSIQFLQDKSFYDKQCTTFSKMFVLPWTFFSKHWCFVRNIIYRNIFRSQKKSETISFRFEKIIHKFFLVGLLVKVEIYLKIATFQR